MGEHEGRKVFYLIQPWQTEPRGKYDHRGQMLSAHTTLAEAYAALDAYYDRMQRFGLPLDTLELYVVNEAHRPVPRPGTH